MIVNTTFTARGDADPRVAELQELAAVEGIKLAMSIEMILWFEDQGVTVDLRTGVAMQVSIERVTPSGRAVNHLLSPTTDEDLDALIDEVYGKPGLGVEDSAGLFDDGDAIEDAYLAGTGDQAAGCYNPPRGCIEAHDAYIRGHNDAWAKAQKVTWWRRR